MPILDRLDSIAGGAINRAFGELVTVTPRIASSYARGVDPARPAKTVTAVVSIGPDPETLAATNAGGDFRKGRFIGVAESTVHITAEVAKTLGYEILPNDLITLSSRPGSPRFTVMLASKSDLGDTLVSITAETPL